MKRFLIFCIAAVLVLCSCEKSGDNGIVASETDVVYGGILNLSMLPDQTLNPLLAQEQTVRDALFAVYEPLIAVTAEHELKGVLAEEWSFNSDCTALTIELRKDVLWHDGRELTAKDVVYSVNTIKSRPDSCYAPLIRYVEAASETGSHSVKLTLSRSYSQLLYSLYFPIIPLAAGDLTSAAVGTGPFMFESYNPGQNLQLMRFEGYRGGDAGFDKVVFNIVKEKVTAASTFSTGVTNAAKGSILDSEDFAVRDKYKVERCGGSLFEYIGLNHSRPVFSSPTVRSALSGAVNREEIVLDGYAGAAVAANLPMHPMALGYSPSKALTDYNAAGAKESLFYDGWVDDGGAALSKELGGDEAAENVRLSFSLLVNSENPRRVMAANIIAAQLGEAGFEVNVTQADFETYKSRIESGDFDAYLGGTQIGNLYDLEFLLASGGEQNYFGYSSEYMDKALAALAAAPDSDSFYNSCAAVQEVFVREQPIVGIAFIDDSLVMSKDIAGGTAMLFNSPFGNVGKWFFVE